MATRMKKSHGTPLVAQQKFKGRSGRIVFVARLGGSSVLRVYRRAPKDSTQANCQLIARVERQKMRLTLSYSRGECPRWYIPTLACDNVSKTRDKCGEAYEQLTGQPFDWEINSRALTFSWMLWLIRVLLQLRPACRSEANEIATHVQRERSGAESWQ